MNYSLDTPISRKVYVPGESEIPFAPITYPKKSQETDQTHRHMQWLFHKPQNAAIFPIQPQAVKIEKKK
jgi:hypothetical protein